MNTEDSQIQNKNIIINFLLNFDIITDGRRYRLLIGLSIIQAVLAPAIDRAISTLRDNKLIGTTAQDIGSISFAGFSAISLLSSTITLFFAINILAGRAAAFATSHDEHSLGALLNEARSILQAEWEILKRKGIAEAILIASSISYIALSTLRDILRIFRFAIWEGPISWFSLKETFISKPFIFIFKIENIIEIIILIISISIFAIIIRWFFQPIRISQPSQIRSARIASSLPNLVDLNDQTLIARVVAAFHGNIVERILNSIREWRYDTPLEDESDLHLKLRSYFIMQGFSVESEVWMGRVGRADLVLNDAVVVELKFGALKANERNRVMGQSITYANYWKGRGPIIIVCVEAPQSRLDEVSKSVTSWNRSLSDNEYTTELPAPIIVLSNIGNRKIIQ